MFKCNLLWRQARNCLFKNQVAEGCRTFLSVKRFCEEATFSCLCLQNFTSHQLDLKVLEHLKFVPLEFRSHWWQVMQGSSMSYFYFCFTLIFDLRSSVALGRSVQNLHPPGRVDGVSKHVGYPLNGFLSWCCHTMPDPIDSLDYATNLQKHTHEIAWITINVDQVHIWIHHTHSWVIFFETCIRKSIMSHTAIGMPLPRGTTIQEKIEDRELI